MKIKYFAKVTNMQNIEVAIAQDDAEAKSLRDQKFEQCSRTFYESAIRNANNVPLATE